MGDDGIMKRPAPSARTWYNPIERCPAHPGSTCLGQSRDQLTRHPGFFSLHKAVRHSLLAKLTIPITTVRSAHTAMIVWGSIGFSDLSKLPRTTKHRAHCGAMRSFPVSDQATGKSLLYTLRKQKTLVRSGSRPSLRWQKRRRSS